ncbi:MAG: hypothetical protein HY318_14505, partial [Armatimonadetes bacterium]|nr:hypothetical protein [Armatimonadota bacterium]
MRISRVLPVLLLLVVAGGTYLVITRHKFGGTSLNLSLRKHRACNVTQDCPAGTVLTERLLEEGTERGKAGVQAATQEALLNGVLLRSLRRGESVHVSDLSGKVETTAGTENPFPWRVLWMPPQLSAPHPPPPVNALVDVSTMKNGSSVLVVRKAKVLDTQARLQSAEGTGATMPSTYLLEISRDEASSLAADPEASGNLQFSLVPEAAAMMATVPQDELGISSLGRTQFKTGEIHIRDLFVKYASVTETVQTNPSQDHAGPQPVPDSGKRVDGRTRKQDRNGPPKDRVTVRWEVTKQEVEVYNGGKKSVVEVVTGYRKVVEKAPPGVPGCIPLPPLDPSGLLSPGRTEPSPPSTLK